MAQPIPGVREVNLVHHTDVRGSLTKLLNPNCAEEFCTYSQAQVFRGFHCAVPPGEMYKMVTCIYGFVWDVLIDLRAGSPTFREYRSWQLSAKSPTMLIMPPGIAHGFFSLYDAVMIYKVGRVHDERYDKGIRWDSMRIVLDPFPDPHMGIYRGLLPTVSARDAALPTMEEFLKTNPFVYKEEEQRV